MTTHNKATTRRQAREAAQREVVGNDGLKAFERELVASVYDMGPGRAELGKREAEDLHQWLKGCRDARASVA